MIRLINGCLAVALAMVLAAPVMAEEGQQSQGSGSSGGGWQQFKQDMKEAGHNMGEAGKEIGHGVADGAKKGSKAVKEYFAPDSGKGSKGSNSK